MTKRKAIDPVAEETKLAEQRARVEAARRAAAEEPDLTLTQREARVFEKAEILVVTSAMNNTPVWLPFWQSLQRYVEARHGELLVLPTRYRNPTSPREAQAQEEAVSWAAEVTPHLADNRFKVHPFLWIMGDVPVSATAANPLTGLDAMTRGASAIFGHAQFAMETIPTPQNELPKILHTTGSVTERNYSRSKAGRRAEFHHTFAALVIEKSGKAFHLRQLVADSEGGFYDFGGDEPRYYHSRGSRKAGRALALVTGDTHTDRADPRVLEATYWPGGIVERLKPETLVWHDLLDFQSDSHWNNPVERIALAIAGKHIVEEEVERALSLVMKATPRDTVSVIIPSNHNAHLSRWALERDWRKVEAVNAEFLLEVQLALVRGAKAEAAGVQQVDPLKWWASEHGFSRENVRFLRLGESFRIAAIELGFHGHRGPSGVRGSRRNLDKMGTRSIIGHSHSPGIYRGTTQVGTSSLLDLTYQEGAPSGWLHTHCVIWPNGKRQLINIIDGKWHA